MALTIPELTEAMNALVRAKGWYDPTSPHPQTLRNLAISLSLEAGEVLEHFQWRDKTADNLGNVERVGLSSELADVALYLLQLASLSGIDLEQAVIDKLNVNYTRTWENK